MLLNVARYRKMIEGVIVENSDRDREERTDKDQREGGGGGGEVTQVRR